MNMDERIRRINELYHKSQAEGLTEEEKQEQAVLRKEYVDSVRANLQVQLNGISIERPDGSIEKLNNRLQKSRLRKEVLAVRDVLEDEERKKAAFLLTERILGHQWFYLSDTVLGFVSYGSEIETREILQEALRKGKRLYVPKIEGEEMVFYRIFSLDELRVGYKGIMEPTGNTEVFRYEEQTADRTLMLMPGAAFDRQRNRIGYGKGFYDKYLADKGALQLRTIAVGYQCQMLDSIPAEATDIKPYQVICV